MVRVMKKWRVPRISLTIGLLLYCFLGIVYLSTFSKPQKTFKLIIERNYKQNSEVKNYKHKEFEVQRQIIQFERPTAAKVNLLRKCKTDLIKHSLE